MQAILETYTDNKTVDKQMSRILLSVLISLPQSLLLLMLVNSIGGGVASLQGEHIAFFLVFLIFTLP